jgi:hypothetical protein
MIAIDITREAERNRALRRVDWRYLLPNPHPAQSVCFADRPLASAVELISAHVADIQSVASASCDLAVATDPSLHTLRLACDALDSGGTCYTEWRSPLAGGARGVRRRLELAGFEDVACYWPWSDPARAATQFWVPLDAPGALHYFVSSRPGTRSKLLRYWYRARRAIWQLALGANVLFPICAVARKPRSGEQSADCSKQASARSSLLLLSGGPRSTSKVVALTFEEPDPQPRLAIKYARVPEAAEGLAREAATLQAVERMRAGGVAGVPQVRFFHEQAGLCAVGETAVTGRPLLALLQPNTFRSLALQATDWLARFAGRPRPVARASWWPRLVGPALTDFSDAFGEAIDSRLWQATLARLGALGDLPLVCEQRDFSPWNVLVAGDGTLVILDWESAELQGLPALDLIYFLTYLAFFHDGAIRSGRYREAYRAALNPASATGAVMAECLERYAGQVGISCAALQPLRLLAWLIHARSEYRRLVADAGRQPDSAALASSLFRSLWEEEIRHAVHAEA